MSKCTWRHCKHCGFLSHKVDAMKRHIGDCLMNPKRKCQMCGQKRSVAALGKILRANGIEQLVESVAGCRDCVLSVLLQAKADAALREWMAGRKD